MGSVVRRGEEARKAGMDGASELMREYEGMVDGYSHSHSHKAIHTIISMQ